MPIQFQTTDSVQEVKRQLRLLEAKYGMSSSDFTAHGTVNDVVPEFDAIEWSFLLMQERCFGEDRFLADDMFSSRTVTNIDSVDVADTYECVAA